MTDRQPIPPDLTALLETQKRDIQKSINCVQIGVIKEFDPATQLATIQIAMKQILTIDDAGKKTFQEYPLIIQCPCVVLFGGIDFMSMPITIGDNCIVLFNDRDIDSWVTTGNDQFPVTPRIHDFNDAFALVGIRSLTNSITTYLTNGIRLSHAAGGNIAKMDFTDALIHSTATLFEHTGNMLVTGNSEVGGNQTVDGDSEIKGDQLIDGNLHVKGNIQIDGTWKGHSGGAIDLEADLIQASGYSIHDGRKCNGTFDHVTVVDGIVVSGT